MHGDWWAFSESGLMARHKNSPRVKRTTTGTLFFKNAQFTQRRIQLQTAEGVGEAVLENREKKTHHRNKYQHCWCDAYLPNQKSGSLSTTCKQKCSTHFERRFCAALEVPNFWWFKPVFPNGNTKCSTQGGLCLCGLQLPDKKTNFRHRGHFLPELRPQSGAGDSTQIHGDIRFKDG